MEIKFTNADVIFIYGHFVKEVRRLEDAKNSPDRTISKTDLNKEIKLYSSIIEKLKDSCPSLSTLDKLTF